MSTEFPTASQPVSQLVFLLGDVADWHTLAADIPANAGLYLLDAQGDALVQMASLLSSYSELQAIHLVSHGEPGSLSLGTVSLNSSNLPAHASQLAAIGKALREQGDLLLYGCDVAAGSVGLSFIHELAEATGVDVAASTGPTGPAELGGDWLLEASTGSIETQALEFPGLETTLAAPSISGLSPTVSYTEGSAATQIDSSLTFSGGSSYGGGYVEYSLASSVAGDQLTLQAGNGITVSGSSVYYNGSFIGSLDSTYDGTNGKALRINFTSNFTNPSFESSSTGTGVPVTGWTIVDQEIRLGSTSLGGWTSPSDPTPTPYSSPGESAMTGGSFNWDVAASGSDGGKSLNLYSSGGVADPYGILRGPAAVSDTFVATTGDVLYFDWQAQGGGDAYDAFGYLLNTDTGTSSIVLNSTGADASTRTTWATASVTVPTSGNYKFIFVSGTYDATGGMAVGGSLYIDNFKVYSNSVTDAAAQALTQQVAYQNTAQDAPSGARTLTVTAADGNGATTTETTQLTVVNENDAPSLTGNAMLTAVNEDESAPAGATITSLFGSLFSDADTLYTPSDSLTGLIVVGDASTAGQGKWQYSLDGSTWNDIGSVSTSAGLALSASTLLRFMPVIGDDVEPGSAGYAGTPGSLSVRAVDSTYASSGVTFTSDSASRQTYDTTTPGSTGGSSAVAATSVLLGTSITDWVIDGTAVNDALTGSSSGDKIKAYDGNDTLTGGGGSDTMYGYLGDDVLVADDSDALIDGGSGIDTARFAAGVSAANLSDAELVRIENVEITNTGNAAYDFSPQTESLNISGNSGNDTITGGTNNDSINGDAGNDSLNGGEGADTILGGNGDDTLTGGNGADSLLGGDGDDILIAEDTDALLDGGNHSTGDTARFAAGVSAANLLDDEMINIENVEITNTGNAAYDFSPQTEALNITGNSGNDTITGGSGTDTLSGGDGDDLLIAQDSDGLIDGGDGIDTARFASGLSAANLLDDDLINVENIEITNTGDAAYDFSNQSEDINVSGNNGKDTITGGAGEDSLDGGKGNDSLDGGGGDDTLNGGAGDDTMKGGAGDDLFYVDSPRDSVEGGDGNDTVNYALGDGMYVQSAFTYTLGSDVENVILGGSRKLNAIGNTAENRLTGNAQDNILDGKGGADTLVGGLGNDSYFVDDEQDLIEELADEGTDSVESTVSYTLSAHVENLILKGSGNVDATGNDLNNKLIGNAGSNLIDGGLGADTLMGGAGNDTYHVDNAGDVITESSNGGTDLVRVNFAPTGSTYTLGKFIENAVLVQSGAYNLTGNELNNELTGNSDENILIGNAGDDTLDGGAGADVMIGGTGNDLYFVDDTYDTVTETSAAHGIDTVRSSVSFQLGIHVEHLELTGADNIRADGNALANRLQGNTGNNILSAGAGNDTLDGGLGADAMLGGIGNDTYYVDDAGDSVTEDASGGTDTVLASISFALGGEIENLTLTGSANIDATGNNLANTLTGNAGNNRLDGGTGADMMAGGAGNDTYVIDNTGDKVTENTNSGTDLVEVAITTAGTYILSNNVENGTLVNSVAFNLTGNNLSNTLRGNGWANLLDGSQGNDVMLGGDGNDIYVVDSTGDVVTEASNEGSDLVRVAIANANGTYVLGENIEHGTLVSGVDFNLTGNTANNELRGNAKANILNGGGGTDSMFGGAGNDTYIVDSADDVVSEVGGGGVDTVLSSVTYSLNTVAAAGVEKLTLTGSANLNATGNALKNSLTGNTGNNLLDGGTGADTMAGGDGDDIYVVDNTGDMVIEGISAGTDLVRIASTKAKGNYTLHTNVENATLTNAVAFNLKGNAQDNVLTGNAQANTILGDAGNDTLIGGAGADLLTGGTGSDTFSFSAGDSGQASGFDQISDYAKGAIGTGDLIDFSATLSIGGSSAAATSSQASINQTTGLASFASGSGRTMSDALADIAASLTTGGDGAGEFALFRVNNAGNYYLFISDGSSGVTVNDVVVQLTGVTSLSSIDLTGGNLTIVS